MMVDEELFDYDPEFQVDNSYKAAHLSKFAGQPPVLVDNSSPCPSWLSSLEPADFQHWSSYSCWNLDQTTALFIGVSPYRFDWSIVSTYLAEDRHAQSCYRLRQLANYELFYDKMLESPVKVLAWAKARNFQFPDGLLSAVDTSNLESASRAALDDGWNGVSTARKKGIFKLLISLLIDGYGIDPTTDNVKGMKRVSGLMEVMQFGADASPGPGYDTIRKIIKEAVGITEINNHNVEVAMRNRARRPPSDDA